MANRGIPRPGIHTGIRAAGFFAFAFALLSAGHAFAQPVPPAPPAPGVSAPPGPTAVPTAVPSAVPGEIPSASPGVAPPAPEASAEATASPVPTPSPTEPPIIVDPPNATIVLGGVQRLHLLQVAGTVTVVSAEPAIADASIDQETRTLIVVGRALGTTTLTVSDARGQTRTVPVRVALPAGSVADGAKVRITGRPATELFVKEQAAQAAIRRAVARPGSTIVVSQDTISVPRPLRVDELTEVDVPVLIQGPDYITVQGTTKVQVENFAQPVMRPASLYVSDFPERLSENGVLFSADLPPYQAQRFLYYHYNPAGQPARRIVLKAENSSQQPALVQFISGQAGPESNEMEAGHLSTERFLVRLAQNEGTVLTIPPGTTATLVDQALPPGTIVSNLLQLFEIEGAPLHLTLLAQDANDPVDGPVPKTGLLSGDHPHARGIYPIPEFFFDYAYDASGEDLEIPIGQIPLPNLLQGQALAGDYGVLQSVTIRMSNYDRRNARNVALYANPRGGRATGTFIIDGVLVQAHALPPFSHYKLRQYTIPPGGFVRTEIVTMPEGGSSYPLRLIVAPDDGSAAPGAPDSLVY
jgi:hypothetical protein